MCGYFYIGVIYFIIKSRNYLDYAVRLFSSNKYEKNNKLILKYFQTLKIYLINKC